MDSTQDQRRARATRPQLEILEAAFATNSHPNLKVREELGGRLGMTERSVQIWFQNKRAKAKASMRKKSIFLREEAMKRRHITTMPAASVFSCDALSIGAWQRINTPATPLVCGYNAATASMSWTLGHLGASYNISFAFEDIHHIQLSFVGHTNAQLSFHVSTPPAFATLSHGTWVACPGFIPSRQSGYTHSLLGNAGELQMQLLALLQHSPLLAMRTNMQPTAKPYSSPLSEGVDFAPYTYHSTHIRI